MEPCLTPLEGGIRIHVFCTGLASDIQELFGTLSADDTLGVEDTMEDDPKERFKVRLVCQKPECDVVVKARCIGKNRLIISSALPRTALHFPSYKRGVYVNRNDIIINLIKLN